MNVRELVSDLSTSRFLGPVILPDDPDYDRFRRIWNGCFDRRPALILRARDVDDVRRAVGLASAQGLALAVRGGGHSIPGFSSCDGGLMLDLSLMDSVTVDPVARIVTVGGGALLGQVDAAGAEHGLATPAGVISHTGVGGLTLGGGMGWLSRRFGMTVDSLLAAQVVTAAGEVVNCSGTEETELFWGLRGGGGNFGVVTEFRFRMHELGAVQMAKWNYPLGSAVAVLRGYRDLAKRAPREVSTSFNLSADGLNLTAFASGDAAVASGAILPFGQLGPDVSGGLMHLGFCAFQSRNDGAVPWGRRYYSRGGFLHDLDDAAIDEMVRATTTAPNVDSEIYVIQLGGAITDIAEEATAYSGRGAGFYWVANPIWDDKADDALCLEWGRSWARRLTTLSMETNYVNEQGDAEGGTEAAYGAAKFARLAALKARFDPQNLFKLNQNILPCPSRVPQIVP